MFGRDVVLNASQEPVRKKDFGDSMAEGEGFELAAIARRLSRAPKS